MEIIIGIIGFFAGLFLWASILGSIFGTLPVEIEMVKARIIPKLRWSKIIVPIIFATTVLAVAGIFAITFLYGSLIAGFMLIFNIRRLRSEALQNFKDEMNRFAQKNE